MTKKQLQESTDPSSEVLVATMSNTINDLLIPDNTKVPYQRVSSYGSNSHKWSKKQTEYFYELLGMFGTDFSIMAANYHPQGTQCVKKRKNRSKKQLLNKYKKQERQNRQRITQVFDVSWKLKAFGQLVENQVPAIKSKPARIAIKECQRNKLPLPEKVDFPLIKNYSTSVSQNSLEESECESGSFQKNQKKNWPNQQNQYCCQI